MTWQTLTPGSSLLGALAGATPAGLARCDAHAIWACVSDFDGYPRELDPGTGSILVPVALEVSGSATEMDRRNLAAKVRPGGVYSVLEDSFWTGLVRDVDLPTLADDPLIVRWRIGLPAIPTTDPSAPQPLAPGFLPNIPVVGLIDHGIALANRAFRSAIQPDRTRFISLWDQDRDRLEHNPVGAWGPVKGLGYGGELTGKTIDTLVADAGADEASVYRQLAYEPPLARVGHGTHVLSLAAGSPNPLLPPDRAGERPQWDGCWASQAPIIAVQLPYRPAKDTSGSALCVHVLDALHYIASRVPSSHPVVVNLSDGAYGGPHDGSSLLERAIDDFLVRQKGRVTLVLAAGNAHEERGHACFASLPAGHAGTLRWRVLPDDGTISFAELWFDRMLAPGEVVCRVTPPGAGVAQPVPLGGSAVLQDAGGVVAAVISRVVSPNGSARSMFLLALAPTRRRSGSGPVAPHGVWGIEVANLAAADPVRVDAFIERDNPALNDRGPRRQSHFEDDDRLAPQAIDRGRTLGSLGGAAQPVVVGARYRRGVAFSGTDPSASTPAARYSSRGPGRLGPVPGPDLSAPSDESPVSHGVYGAGSRSGAKVRMDGTSVAAPIVTRRLLNLLFQAPDPRPPGKTLLPSAGPNPPYDGTAAEVRPGEEPT